MANKGVNEKRRILLEQRRASVALLLKGRMSYTEIAQRLGVANSTVTSDIKAIRKEWALERRRTSLDDEFELDLHTVNDVIRGSYGDARSGSPAHARVVLDAVTRRAKMFGYDAPDRSEVTSKVTLEGVEELSDEELMEIILKGENKDVQ